MDTHSIAFDRAADFYDQTRGFPPGEADAIARLIVATGGLGPSAQVCDAGIGTGRIALPLAAHARRVTGVDLARPMLVRLLGKRDEAPCDPVQADVTRLPYASGVFDAVLAVHIFHLVADWHRGLREAARVLRPEGVLLAGWNDRGRPADPTANLYAIYAAASGRNQQPNVGVPREQYGTFLADSGWRQVGEPGVHTYPVTRTTRDFVDMLARRVWSSTWRLSDAAHARGMAAVQGAIAEQGIDIDAPVTVEGVFRVTAYRPPA